MATETVIARTVVVSAIQRVHRRPVRLSDSAQAEIHRLVLTSIRQGSALRGASRDVVTQFAHGLADELVRSIAGRDARRVVRAKRVRGAKVRLLAALSLSTSDQLHAQPHTSRSAPAMKIFADNIRKNLTDAAYRAVRSTGVGSFEELYAFAAQFPTVAANPEISVPVLSNMAATKLSAPAMAEIRAEAEAPPSFSMGSAPPPDSSIEIGYTNDLPLTPPEILELPAGSVTCADSTPVRDQGQRGTCVAHAVAACNESRLGHADLSEQFLYWAAKLRGGDPYPAAVGTWLRCARNALQTEGVCTEALWPYNPVPLAGNEAQEITGTSPSAQAGMEARTRRHAAAGYQDVAALTSGKAGPLAARVAQGPVAISVPVFFDPTTNFSNWNWSGAQRYGHVLDPTPYSIVRGGHAVCACGFVRSGAAPGGGWFIFKNSWGMANWSNQTSSPPAGHPSVPAGYGYLSATYVDQFLWEYLQL